MAVYLIAYLSILFITLIYQKINRKTTVILLAIWTVYVGLVCGLRDMLGGYDSYIYAEVFDATSDELDRGVPFWSSVAFALNPTEQGYAIFNVLVAYITANRYIFLFITSVFIFVSLYIHIIKYSKYPIYAFFILFCMWYFFSFTYLRQVMAACIAWFAIPYAIKRKPLYFFLLVALATSFHNSAALFGLIYFIAHRRFSKNQILTYLMLSLFVGFTPIGNFLFGILGGAMNEEKAAAVLAHTNEGRIDYIIEAVFFFILIYARYEKIAKDKVSTCMLNIALLFIFMLTFFVRFYDGGRMSWFFMIGIAVTTAQIATRDDTKALFKIIMLSVATLLYFRILMGWGNILMPYKSFLSDDVRSGDVIWEKYEYDHNYDDDKLYRPVFKFMRKDE